jgi:hypothetical protein
MAPELLLASYVRRIHATPGGAQLDLPARIAEAAAATGGPEAATPAKRPACPLVLRGVCVVHPVRPLACRGHAAFDRQACALAIAGREVEVPVSEPHAHVRAMVQNALQAALRAAGHAWRSYALIEALHLLLREGIDETGWGDGEDALAPALAPDVDWAALGAAFDAVGGTA